MKKALAIIAAAAILSGCSFTANKIPKTGVDLNGDLLVVYDGDKASDYSFIGDKILTEGEVFVDGHGEGYAGRRFKPSSEGETTMLFRIKDITQDVVGMKVFDITVDDKKVITYTERDVTPYPLAEWIKTANYSMMVYLDGAMQMVIGENSTVIMEEAESLFGTAEETTEQEVMDNTEEMAFFEMTIEGPDGMELKKKLWIDRDGNAYSYDERSDGTAEWKKYTPDASSSCARLFGQIDLLIADSGMFKDQIQLGW